MAEFGRLTVVATGPGSARRFEVLLTGVVPALSAFAIPTLCGDLLFKVLERLQSYKQPDSSLAEPSQANAGLREARQIAG